MNKTQFKKIYKAYKQLSKERIMRITKETSFFYNRLKLHWKVVRESEVVQIETLVAISLLREIIA